MYKLDVELMGANIKNARIKAQMTQEQLALMVETSKTTIIDIEKGNKKSGGAIDLIAKICYALNISIDEVCGMKTKEEPDNKQQEKEKLFNALKTLLDYKDVQHTITAERDFSSEFPHALLARINIDIWDTGLSYFLQEYLKTKAIIESSEKTPYYDDIKTVVLKALESRFEGMEYSETERQYCFKNKVLNIWGEVGEECSINLEDKSANTDIPITNVYDDPPF